jgi:hypothetical protein
MSQMFADEMNRVDIAHPWSSAKSADDLSSAAESARFAATTLLDTRNLLKLRRFAALAAC